MAGIENALEHNTLIRAIKMYSDGIRPEEGTNGLVTVIIINGETTHASIFFS